MSEQTKYPTGFDDDSTLPAGGDGTVAFLTAPITAIDVTLPIGDTSAFPVPSIATIGGEHIEYTGKTATDLTGCTRGVHQENGGWEPRPHDAGTLVRQATTANSGPMRSIGHRIQNGAIRAIQSAVNTIQNWGLADIVARLGYTPASVTDIPVPGGIEGSLQYNKLGEFAGDTTGLIWDDVARRLGIGAPPTNQTVHTVGGPGIGAGYRADRFTNDASSPVILLAKSRSDVVNQHGAVAAGDNIGGFYFWGSDGVDWRPVAQLLVKANGIIGSGVVPGLVMFLVMKEGNVFTRVVEFSASQFVVNELGRDIDTRFEGDLDPNLFFTDASTDRVGVGTNSPASKLDVAGTVQADGLRLDVTPTAETIAPTHTITISVNGVNYKLPCVAA